MAIQIESDVPYFGFQKNIRVSNGEIELVFPTEYGPRIQRFARAGGENIFGEVSPLAQGNDTPFGDRWHIYGGHRLWYAPESDPRSYWPDNAPVDVVTTPAAGGATRITLTQRIEEHSRLLKTLSVTVPPAGVRVDVVHRLDNRGAFDVELAPWALSVMAKGGRAIFPHADFVPHPVALAPARPLVLWPFTRMNDPRWTWGDRYFYLRQDPGATTPQKVGFYDDRGWMAYALGALLFVKTHRPRPGPHADFGCNVETFTNEGILELETLGPLVRLAPGASIEHDESWYLHDGVTIGDSEDALSEALAPLLPPGASIPDSAGRKAR